MSMWPEWFEPRSVFSEGDLADTEYVRKVHAQLKKLRDELDQKSLIKAAEASICIEKRRYSTGDNRPVPFGYHHPSEAYIVNTINVRRGKLLRTAKNPSFVYDYDSDGRVVRICQMENDRIFTTVHCIYDENENIELRICWSPKMIDDCGEAQYESDYDNELALIGRDEEGKLLFNSFTFFLGKRVDSKIELYGRMESRQQKMNCYSLATDEQDNVEMILRTKHTLIYDEAGKLVEVLSGKQEILTSGMMAEVWI